MQAYKKKISTNLHMSGSLKSRRFQESTNTMQYPMRPYGNRSARSIINTGTLDQYGKGKDFSRKGRKGERERERERERV